VDVTGIEGPTSKQTASKERVHQERTWGPTQQPPGGSTDLVAPNARLPRGIAWLVLESIPEVLAVLPQGL
jgi:hypothetical protein